MCECVAQSGQLEFPWPDSVRLVTGLLHHTSTYYRKCNQLTSFRSPSLRMGKRSDTEEREWEESGIKDEKEGGRAGQGLSVEKTAMKGNCHAPVLTQEHLSQKEHAKCAGHVLTTPSLFYTQINTLVRVHIHSQSSQEKTDAPPSERHHLSDSMPVKLSLDP